MTFWPLSQGAAIIAHAVNKHNAGRTLFCIQPLLVRSNWLPHRSIRTRHGCIKLVIQAARALIGESAVSNLCTGRRGTEAMSYARKPSIICMPTRICSATSITPPAVVGTPV